MWLNILYLVVLTIHPSDYIYGTFFQCLAIRETVCLLPELLTMKEFKCQKQNKDSLIGQYSIYFKVIDVITQKPETSRAK